MVKRQQQGPCRQSVNNMQNICSKIFWKLLLLQMTLGILYTVESNIPPRNLKLKSFPWLLQNLHFYVVDTKTSSNVVQTSIFLRRANTERSVYTQQVSQSPSWRQWRHYAIYMKRKALKGISHHLVNSDWHLIKKEAQTFVNDKT